MLRLNESVDKTKKKVKNMGEISVDILFFIHNIPVFQASKQIVGIPSSFLILQVFIRAINSSFSHGEAWLAPDHETIYIKFGLQ